jgi:hypothetical protein
MRQELSMSRRKRRKFDADFKREAVALTKVGDRSVGEVSRDLDLLGGHPKPATDGRLKTGHQE